MIVGGTTAAGSSKKAHKTYLRMVHNVQLTGSVPKMPRIDNPIIRFSEEDAQCLHHLMMMRSSSAYELATTTRIGFWLTTATQLTSYTTQHSNR